MQNYRIEHGLHDAEVVGVKVMDGGAGAVIELSRVNGTQVSVHSRGILAFRAVDMAMQNVVSRVCISTAETDVAWLTHRLSWATERIDATSYLSNSAMEEYVRRLQTDDLKLIWIEPSVGVELVAVCESIEFSPQRGE